MKLTKQDIFNKVWERAKVKVCSQSEDELETCLYHGLGGGCFVGILIPDEIYSECMELRLVNDIISSYPKFREILSEEVFSNGVFGEFASSFLTNLQEIHDTYDPETEWEPILRDLAAQQNLLIPE